MDLKRPSPPLPHGLKVTIMYAMSRGGALLGIESADLAQILGLDPSDYISMSDWASINDAHFYAAVDDRFSYDIAIAEAAVMNLPRVVFYRILKEKHKKPIQAAPADEPAEPVELVEPVPVTVKKKRTPAKRKAR